MPSRNYEAGSGGRWHEDEPPGPYKEFNSEPFAVRDKNRESLLGRDSRGEEAPASPSPRPPDVIIGKVVKLKASNPWLKVLQYKPYFKCLNLEQSLYLSVF